MKLNRPPGDAPELMRPGGLSHRPGRGLSVLGICLLAAVIGGPASLAGAASPNTHVQRPRLAAFVGGTPQTISFDQPLDTKVGEPVTLSASAAPGLEVSFTSNTPAVCMVSGPSVTTTTAGVCAITASQDGDVTYAAAPEVARSFQVTAGQAGQTITFTSPAGTTAGALVSLSASAAPDPALVVSFTSDTPQVCTVSGFTAQTVAAGACIITASQGGSATYAAAPQVARSFQVTTGQAAQTITFTPPGSTMAGVPVSLSASAAPGLDVSFTTSTPAVCTVSGSTVQTVTSGTCTITASQGGSTGFAPAPDVTQSFQVNPVTSQGAGARFILLAAAILTAAGLSFAVRRWQLRSRPSPGPPPVVRVVPDAGPPGSVSVHHTGTAMTHTVQIQPSRGTSITTIKEARP